MSILWEKKLSLVFISSSPFLTLFNPQAAGPYLTHLPVGRGFQLYRKSLKIGHKQFYGQLNDKEL